MVCKRLFVAVYLGGRRNEGTSASARADGSAGPTHSTEAFCRVFLSRGSILQSAGLGGADWRRCGCAGRLVKRFVVITYAAIAELRQVGVDLVVVEACQRRQRANVLGDGEVALDELWDREAPDTRVAVLAVEGHDLAADVGQQFLS